VAKPPIQMAVPKTIIVDRARIFAPDIRLSGNGEAVAPYASI